MRSKFYRLSALLLAALMLLSLAACGTTAEQPEGTDTPTSRTP